jgi:radical SAM protein with 4Fe4S-binding SPASM domain
MKRFRRVNIEISNICNLQCSFCPEVHREKKVMSRALFEKVIQEVAPLTDEVCLHLMGEPLGHPELSSFVDICEHHGVPINLTTNGTLIDEVRTEILLRSVVRQVNFSVQSFEANFGGQDVSRYLNRIFSFTKRAFIERLWDLADPVSLTDKNRKIREKIEKEFSFSIEGLNIDLRRKKGYLIQGRLYLNFDSRFEWPSLSQPVRSDSGFCHGLSNHFGIHADGKVVPCCLDKEAVLDLGNCEDFSVLEILESERAKNIRNGFENRRLVEDLCRRCPFIERFDKKTSSKQKLLSL